MNASNNIEDCARKITAKFKDQVQTTFLNKLSEILHSRTTTKTETKFFVDFEPKMAALITSAKLNLNDEEMLVLREHLHVEVVNQSNHHDYLLDLFRQMPFGLELVVYNNRVWCRVSEIETGYIFNLAFQHNNKDLLQIAYGNNSDAYSDQTHSFESYCSRCNADLVQVKKLIDILICYWKKGDYTLFAVA